MAKARKLPVRRDARMRGQAGLQFDNFKREQLVELTVEEKSEAFLSRFLETVDPFVRFERYFATSALSPQHILKLIKQMHRELVGSERWTEQKFTEVVTMTMEKGQLISPMSLDIVARELERSGGRESLVKNRMRRRSRL